MANRQRIEMSNQLFNALFARAEHDGVTILDQDKARWLKRHSAEDAELMAKADVRGLILSRQMRAARVRHSGQSYFVAAGFPVNTDALQGLTEASLTPGLFSASILELGVSPKATGSQIRDAIEDYHESYDGYEGHDLDSISELYPSLVCFSLNENFDVAKSTSRLVGAYLSRFYIDGPLDFSDGLREKMAHLFESGSKHIPFQVALQGLVAFNWPGLFVELYRCIEQLYTVPRLVEVTKEWKTDKSLRDLADLLERTLSWRPKEDQSLTRLLQTGCTSATISSAAQALKVEVPEDQAQAADVTARAIYRARNSLVHFRPAGNDAQFTAREWDSVIISMIAIIDELYRKFGRTFHATPV